MNEPSSQPGFFDEEQRFRIVGKLGEGGMGVVYEVFDRQRGATLALKTIGRPDAKGIYRLKKEFRALSGLRHPNLVNIHELGCAGERWFFTMDRVDGCEFVEHVRGVGGGAAVTVTGDLTFDWYLNAAPPSNLGTTAGAFDEDALRSALSQLASALLTLHRAGRVHRDLKPSNVMVDRQGRVRVLDFGIVGSSDSGDASLESAVVGTPRYMAPEQATGEAVGPAADWYAVGVMLYEALTGVVPFGGSVIDVLTSKQTSDAPDPREMAPQLPDDLARLCVELLARDPASRPSGEQVLASVARGDGPGPPPLLDAIAETVGFVGRRAELAQLVQAYEDSRRGAVVVHLRGAEGVGKTALARHVLRNTSSEALVLAGCCHPRESVPYKALDAVVDSLARYLNAESPERMAELTVDGLGALVRLFPVLGRVRGLVGVRDERPADLHNLRRRGFVALRQLLCALAAARPLVLMIDDAQWGDADSAVLLAELLRPPAAPALLLLLCYRSDEARDSPLLTRMRSPEWSEEVGDPPRDLELSPLPQRDAAELARRLLGNDSAADVAALTGQAAGDPRLLAELAAHARRGAGVERGMLARTVAAQLEGLPLEVKPLLELLAVADGSLDAEVAFALCAVGSRRDAWEPVVRLRCVPERGGRAREVVDFHHRGARPIVLAGMSAERRSECHATLARALEDRGAAERAAWHHEHAGASEQAREAWIRAALEAREALAFDRTAELFRHALSLDQRARRRWLLEQLGDALSAAGRGVEAADAYLRAAEAPVDDELAALRAELDLRRLAAEHLLKSGRIDEGLMVMREVLSELGMRLPSTPRRALMALSVQRARLALRGLEPGSGAGLDERARQRMDACWSLAVGLSMADTVMGAYFHARHLALAMDSGDAARVARALAMEAAHVASTASERHARALELLEKSARTAQRIGDAHALAMVELMRGGQAMFASRWRAAVARCDEALALLATCHGNVMWETASAWRFGFVSLFYLGEIDELRRRVPHALAEARARGDRFAESCARSGSSVVVWLAGDDVAAARRQLDEEQRRWGGGRFALQHYLRLQAESYLNLYAGRGELALERLRADGPRMERSMLLRVQLLRSTMWGLRGRAALALGSQASRELSRAIAQLEKEGLPAPSAQALALRAACERQQGRVEAAVALYREAAAQFASLSMTLMAAAMDARRGELLGGDEGRALEGAARAALSAQGVVDGDAMLRMLAP